MQDRYFVRPNKQNEFFSVIDSLSALPATMHDAPLIYLTSHEAKEAARRLNDEFARADPF